MAKIKKDSLLAKLSNGAKDTRKYSFKISKGNSLRAVYILSALIGAIAILFGLYMWIGPVAIGAMVLVVLMLIYQRAFLTKLIVGTFFIVLVIGFRLLYIAYTAFD